MMVYVLRGSEDGVYAVYSSASKALDRAVKYADSEEDSVFEVPDGLFGVSYHGVDHNLLPAPGEGLIGGEGWKKARAGARQALLDGWNVQLDFVSSDQYRSSVDIFPMEVEK